MFERLAIFSTRLAQSSMEKSGHPFELTINIPFADDFMNLVDASDPGFPKGLCRVLTKSLGQMVQPLVRYISQVRSRVTRIAASTAVSLKQGHFCARFFEQICRSNSGQSASDHDCIHL